ncbi:cytochrome c oxidase subunit 6a [Marchantia polymorpha subsp. ruderalis]|uniref:Uncharacterized protein n=2 Tax=Marchantia polymorpha TaxID=3197 RepID=A0AAF6AMF9_MARPO|nr:hypothetical protein MARPO_0043s0104 [Marchantia polymorpha]BBM97629.1 hypothetical protein Mp_1g07110 [Marchantia polymorpha subsp. ruderalis]|eukprot:PTQ39871.1 hypothetical protein MARPO_0043s0104 [Marchantia polymorpha]
MAQFLRQKLGPMLLRPSAAVQPKQIPKRTFSSSAQHEDAEETVKWRNITILGYIGCTLLGAYTLIGGEHHNEERPEYSYLRIRNKEFPWGPDGLFEYKDEHH